MNGDDDDNILLDLGGFGDWVFSPDSIELSVGYVHSGFCILLFLNLVFLNGGWVLGFRSERSLLGWLYQ